MSGKQIAELILSDASADEIEVALNSQNELIEETFYDVIVEAQTLHNLVNVGLTADAAVIALYYGPAHIVWDEHVRDLQSIEFCLEQCQLQIETLREPLYVPKVLNEIKRSLLKLKAFRKWNISQ